MNIKKIIVSLCLFTALTMSAFASSWYWIGQTGNGQNLYIDNSSVNKTSSCAILWVLVTDMPYPNQLNAKQALFKMYILPNATGGWEYMQVQHPDGSITQYNNIHSRPTRWAIRYGRQLINQWWAICPLDTLIFLHTKSANRVGRRYHFIGARYAATPPHLVLFVNPAKGSTSL